MLGPVIGGFVAAGKNWRWTFWLLAILGGFFGSTTVLVLRETHPKVLLERKAAYLRASTGNSNWRSKLDSTLSPRQVLLQVLVRPIMLLVRSPILFMISLYVTLVFGVMYLLFTTFTTVFEGQYGFSTSISGLTYLGLGVALVISMVLFNLLNGRVQAARMKLTVCSNSTLSIVFFLCSGLVRSWPEGCSSVAVRHTTRSIGLFPFLAQV